MIDVLSVIFVWIAKIVTFLVIITIVIFFCRVFWLAVTHEGRKWYYYDVSKPWKGGYWSPTLPDTPPYNEYSWNPKSCRFEHKETGEPLYRWQKPLTRRENTKPRAKKKLPNGCVSCLMKPPQRF